MSLRESERPAQRGPQNKPKPTETKVQRKKRRAKAKAERLALRAQLVATDDDCVLTFKEWCAVNSFSERQGYRILASDKSPVVTRLTSRRVGITRANNRAWQEAHSR
jgi:hypothetical protein